MYVTRCTSFRAQYEVNYVQHIFTLSDIAAKQVDNIDPGNWYTELHTFTTKDDKNIYTASYTGTHSSTGRTMGIKAFTINGNGQLDDSVKFFRTHEQFLNEITIEYDFFSNYDDKTMSQKNIIRMSNDKETLSIPVVKENGIVTEKSLIYKFDGSKFVHNNYAGD